MHIQGSTAGLDPGLGVLTKKSATLLSSGTILVLPPQTNVVVCGGEAGVAPSLFVTNGKGGNGRVPLNLGATAADGNSASTRFPTALATVASRTQ